jgi:hypothetical protein
MWVAMRLLLRVEESELLITGIYASLGFSR